MGSGRVPYIFKPILSASSRRRLGRGDIRHLDSGLALYVPVTYNENYEGPNLRAGHAGFYLRWSTIV